jgi:hypothetical protein
MAATIQKTIEFMLPMLGDSGSTGIAEGTTHTDSADQTIYIPETTSRAFKSVMLKCMVHDCFGTAGNDLAGWSIRVSCDAGVTWTTVTRTTTIADTGENFPMIMEVDVTAEFTARFSGASDTCRWGLYLDFAGSGSLWANASATLHITYEYDAASHTTTQIKTVRIPIESLNGRLTNSAQEVRQGTIVNQLPSLLDASTPFLPEASVSIRQAYCELYFNSLPGSTTDTNLIVKIDSGGSERTSGIIDNTLNTPIFMRYCYDVTSVDWTAVRALYARSTTTTCLVHVGGWLTVTYEYNPSTSTTILNSLLLGATQEEYGVRVSGDQTKIRKKFWIEDPATVTLVQSGIFTVFPTNGTSDTLTFGVGSQTATGYTPTSGGNIAGPTSFVHRIDSGGYRGAGFTLARGENTIDLEYYCGTALRSGPPTFLIILNYTSGKSGSYGEANSRTIMFMNKDFSTSPAATYKATISTVPSIIETNYCVIDNFFEVASIYTGTTAQTIEIAMERQSGEGAGGEGWEQIFHRSQVGTGEVGPMIHYMDAQKKYRRWPTDPETDRMAVEQSRDYQMSFVGITVQISLVNWITYHGMTFTVSGTISGSGGGTVYAHLFRCPSLATATPTVPEYIASTSRTGNGSVSFTIYDSAVNHFAVYYEDGTHIGTSVLGTAS